MEEEEEIPHLSQENFDDYFSSSVETDTEPFNREVLSANNVALPNLDVSSVDFDVSRPSSQDCLFPGTVEFAELLNSIVIPEELVMKNQTLPGYPPLPINYSGYYDFNIHFESPEGRSSWVYSAEKEKLYVTKDKAVPINVIASPLVPAGSKIRAMAVFEQPQYANTVVTRCQHHASEDRAKGIPAPESLVRCESRRAQYEIINNMYTVAVPYEQPQKGQLHSTYIYKFTCFSSCPGTLERKPVKIIFVLEHENTIFGHRSVNIKICACPLRDHNNENCQSLSSSKSHNAAKRKIDQVQPKADPPESLLRAMPSTGTMSRTSCLVASNNWSGNYDFNCKFHCEDSKSQVYSATRDKLYIIKDAQCGVTFTTKATIPQDMTVRVMALFLMPQYVNENVERCAHHLQKDTASGLQNAQHIIRCDHSRAEYCVESESGRLSVCIPLYNSVGCNFPTYNFKFCCFGSCPGGLNRRRIKVIFTLEWGNDVVGRRSLEVKICASPHRDCRNEDNSSTSTSGRTNLAKPKKQCQHSGTNENQAEDDCKKAKAAYSINVDNIEAYKFLKDVQMLYRQRNSTQSSNSGSVTIKKETTSTDESD